MPISISQVCREWVVTTGGVKSVVRGGSAWTRSPVSGDGETRLLELDITKFLSSIWRAWPTSVAVSVFETKCCVTTLISKEPFLQQWLLVGLNESKEQAVVEGHSHVQTGLASMFSCSVFFSTAPCSRGGVAGVLWSH